MWLVPIERGLLWATPNAQDLDHDTTARIQSPLKRRDANHIERKIFRSSVLWLFDRETS